MSEQHWANGAPETLEFVKGKIFYANVGDLERSTLDQMAEFERQRNASQAREAALREKLEATELELMAEQTVAEAMTKRAEAAEARIKASQEQEPVDYVDADNQYRLLRFLELGSALYAQPPIPLELAELQRENAELNRCNDVLHGINAELTRKLAEQQAIQTKIANFLQNESGLDNLRDLAQAMLDCFKSDKTELRKLLEESKVPEGLISVDDMLPETKYELGECEASQSVLLFGKCVAGFNGHGVGHYASDGKWVCYEGEYDNQNIVEVTHWMPLPQPKEPKQ